MAQIFECWFPALGQTPRQAGAYEAETAAEAAERAAERRCWDDAEWDDHVVCVSADHGAHAERFEVSVESRPHFTAKPVS